jgi:hypothetical protein
MALVLQDRVSVNSTGSGTGNLALGSAYPGFRTFASCIPDGSIVYYAISNQAVGYDTQWEVGYGKYVLGTDTLVRNNGNSAETGVYSSSNSNAYVNFTAGANGLQIFITQPSEKAVYQETNGDVLIPNGVLTVVGANATNPTFSATLGEFISNVPTFSQLFAQNQSNNANASTDIVSYNNLGDGTNYFVDMGIASSTYNEAAYPIFQANDAYLYNAGNTAGTGAAGDISRLIIGTSTANSNVVIFGGSVNVNATIATFVASSKDVNFANNISVTSNVSANNINLTNFAYSGANLSNAANSTVLTTKAYVDSAVATGFVVHTPVNLATIAALTGTPTYNNGTDGVGATLTASGVGTLSVDGQNAAANFRILVQSQANAAHNGAYLVTTEGTGGAAYVLTRTTDFNTAGAGEIANNAYFFVDGGDTLAGYSFVLSQLTSPIVVGTTALPFTEFASQITYTGTAPINVSGSTISLTGIVPVANGGTNLSSYTTGDTLYANATNTLTRRAIGAANTVLISNGTIPDWGTVALGSANAVSGTLGPTNGGTGQSTYTLGDIVYANGTNTLAKLAGQTTTTQKFLSQTGNGTISAAPVWDTIPAASITGLGTMSTQNANNVTITGGTLNNVAIGGTTANAGTFTTATATLFAGSGANLTNLNGSNVSSGTIDNARTTAATANGASTIVLRDAGGNFAANTITANLTGTASTATTATTATRATNIAGGAAGSIPYQTAANTTALLATASGVLVGGTTPAYSTAPTLTGTNFSAIPNSALSNSSVTVNGTGIALGGSGTITAANPNAVTFNNGGAGAASGSTYTGASVLTVSYNTVGAPSTTGTNASGNWGINITGSAATATTATTATNQSGGTVSATSVSTSGTYARTAAGTGYLNGGYGTVETVSTSGAIYSIGSAYPPGTTTLGTMYGIGYTYSGGAAGNPGGVPSGIWGMYVASAGTARIFLDSDNGRGYFAGSVTATSFSGAGTGLTGTAASLTAGAATTATTANALNTANAYQGTGFTVAQASPYLYVNRTSAGSGQMGIQFQNAGASLWWNYMDTSATNMTWYNSVASVNVMALSTAGSLTLTGSCTATSFTASSDERLKTNWAGLDLDFVSKLANVKSGTFERIKDGSRDVGVGAQSLQTLIPEAVVEGSDGMLSVNYGGAALVAAIELAKVVEELRAEVKELKAKLANGA